MCSPPPALLPAAAAEALGSAPAAGAATTGTGTGGRTRPPLRQLRPRTSQRGRRWELLPPAPPHSGTE